MTALTSRLATLASTMMLDPVSAVALPTAITVAASKVGMSDDGMIAECERNGELREYLASICRNTDISAALS